MKIGYLKASASDEFGREGLCIGSHGCYKTSVGMTTSVIFFLVLSESYTNNTRNGRGKRLLHVQRPPCPMRGGQGTLLRVS